MASDYSGNDWYKARGMLLIKLIKFIIMTVRQPTGDPKRNYSSVLCMGSDGFEQLDESGNTILIWIVSWCVYPPKNG